MKHGLILNNFIGINFVADMVGVAKIRNVFAGTTIWQDTSAGSDAGH